MRTEKFAFNAVKSSIKFYQFLEACKEALLCCTWVLGSTVKFYQRAVKHHMNAEFESDIYRERLAEKGVMVSLSSFGNATMLSICWRNLL